MLVWRAPVDTVSHGSESTVENGINFIFCLGTTYDISSIESIENHSIVFVDRKSMPLKIFLSLSFLLRALAPLQIPTSLCEGPFFYFMQFLFFIFTLHLLL